MEILNCVIEVRVTAVREPLGQDLVSLETFDVAEQAQEVFQDLDAWHFLLDLLLERLQVYNLTFERKEMGL